MSSISIQSGAPLATRQRAIAVLLADVEEAQRVAAALDEVRRADGPLAVIAVPPVRGLGFFSDAERQDKLDRWWSHAIPRDSEPIYLLRHEEGVPAWLPGLDGHFIIGGAEDPERAEYAAMSNVTAIRGRASADIGAATLTTFERSGMFREDAGPRLQHRLGRIGPSARAGRFRRARLRPADEVLLGGARFPPGTHPIPNLPASPAATPTAPSAPGGDAGTPVAEAGQAELVRALAETLHRLRRTGSTR